MPESVALTVNGQRVVVPSGASVAVALMEAGEPCRTSVTGEFRGPLCGIGICFECRAVVNGIRHSRSCQIMCLEGMDVTSDV